MGENYEQMPKIKNGIVLDHILPERGPFVYIALFPWLQKGIKANIRTNVSSMKSDGGKWVFKLEGLGKEKQLVDRLAIATGGKITISLIENYKVAEKFNPQLPERVIDGLLFCKNPSCVTVNDLHAGLRQEFNLLQKEPLSYFCRFCEKQINRKEIDSVFTQRI